MANMASGGVYQQMVVPASYHFPQPQQQPQEPEPKKEPKKRKKPAEKSNGEKKKPRIIGQSAYMAGLRLEAGDGGGECSRCNKKKCFKHVDGKNKNQLSKKTPEDTVLQMKKHMLRLLSTQDYLLFCKTDQKNGQLDVDISKMHRSYLEEHEPQAFEPATDPNKEYKPKVKQWLYRKIYLDEFKSFEYAEGKRKIGDLRRSIESVMIQKKKKAPKPKPPAPSPQHQDYSMNSHSPNTPAGPTDMSRTAATMSVPPGTIIAASPHTPASTATGGYQPNLMNLGVETTTTPVSSMAAMGATSTLHNSLATYMTQQVQPNLLFGLGQQQQPPPAQQQPLNLQTSHQGQPTMQAPPHQTPGTAAPPTAAPPLPLNLHNHPYYVSLGPMLPLPMSTPQHNHQQQFQQNMLQQQQGIPGGFNQHTMYQ
ncbi:uncharacterized protein DDB_G0284459-like isoform X2 [Eriocheir sinensis]|uniref:uncharacterized protein DDB_G0284459-like isoform X2 n=1 Tax=Eriocheir sinensis TaxID=95602 RepID=UPI0021CA40B5|nr:uncharacterized protein DDB_G0284459-like isoform X2 [Eriocheir sinensis]